MISLFFIWTWFGSGNSVCMKVPPPPPPHTHTHLHLGARGKAPGNSCLILMRSRSGYSEQHATFDPSRFSFICALQLMQIKYFKYTKWVHISYRFYFCHVWNHISVIIRFEPSSASGNVCPYVCVCVCWGGWFSSVDDGVHVGSPLEMAGNTHHMSNQVNTRVCLCMYFNQLAEPVSEQMLAHNIHVHIISHSFAVCTCGSVCVCVCGKPSSPEITEPSLNHKCSHVKQ